jgi:hypothetical protein
MASLKFSRISTVGCCGGGDVGDGKGESLNEEVKLYQLTLHWISLSIRVVD